MILRWGARGQEASHRPVYFDFETRNLPEYKNVLWLYLPFQISPATLTLEP